MLLSAHVANVCGDPFVQTDLFLVEHFLPFEVHNCLFSPIVNILSTNSSLKKSSGCWDSVVKFVQYPSILVSGP